MGRSCEVVLRIRLTPSLSEGALLPVGERAPSDARTVRPYARGAMRPGLKVFQRAVLIGQLASGCGPGSSVMPRSGWCLFVLLVITLAVLGVGLTTYAIWTVIFRLGK